MSERKLSLEKWMTIPTLDWLATQGRFELRWEFRLPWGICDIVGVEFDIGRVEARLSLGQKASIGPPVRIALLSLMPSDSSGESISIQTLSSQMALPIEDVEKEVEELIRRRFVVRKPDGSLQSRTPWAPLHTRILAIELKLHRIEDVIAQASSHKAFATGSLVGLPRDKAERLVKSGRLSSLEKAGVGLLAVDPKLAELLVPAPPSTSIDPVLQVHCVERLWTRYISKGKLT